ncbi:MULTISPECIES: nitroreductase family protein [unclassified Bacillus (in: firmicutes)]|uniref:nitroreductase family protein n=1 Tax=unclassified Bacillus (in: firmicutes) TaxID=185979 RepID=UPI0004E18788|nr:MULTISPECIES: nitroreductase family protein [unclassified Bacillus (in: firmicutes)]
MNKIDVLKRRSVRKYKKGIKISRYEMEQMIKETQQAPSSRNLQPIRFLVCESNEGRQKLGECLIGNELQNQTASAMIIVLADRKGYQKAEKIFTLNQGNRSVEKVKQKVKQIFHLYEEAYSEKRKERIITQDAALASMQLMFVANAHGYDTCPIGGFDEQKVYQEMGIDQQRYIATLILSIGVSDEATPVEAHRLPLEDVVEFL